MEPSPPAEDVWSLVLSYIPIVERLRTCSLVSKALHKAATAALGTSLATRLQNKHCPAFTDWLRSYGDQLLLLEVSGSLGPLWLHELPCQHLQQLVISYCMFVEAPRPKANALQPQHKFSNLASVTNFEARNSTLSAAVLQALTNLTRLHFNFASISTVFSQQSSTTVDSKNPDAAVHSSSSTTSILQRKAAAATALLQALVQLTALKQLHLESLNVKQYIWPEPSEAYACLAASSSLEQLHIIGCPMPVGIWQYALHDNLQLPQLTSLTFLNPDYANASQDHFPDTACMDTQDIDRLVGCCPRLMQLRLSLQPDVCLAALSQVTGLTRLDVRGVGESMIAPLAAVTQLQNLYVELRPETPLGQYALEPLTTLRHLTQLFCDDYDSVGPLGEELENLELKKQAADGVPPDVWEQLRDHCDNVPDSGCMYGYDSDGNYYDSHDSSDYDSSEGCGCIAWR